MPKGWKAIPMRDYLADYTERINGLHPAEALRELRELEEGALSTIKRGNTVKLMTDIEWAKDMQNDLKASRRLIDLQHKRLEKIYTLLKN